MISQSTVAGAMCMSIVSVPCQQQCTSDSNTNAKPQRPQQASSMPSIRPLHTHVTASSLHGQPLALLFPFAIQSMTNNLPRRFAEKIAILTQCAKSTQGSQTSEGVPFCQPITSSGDICPHPIARADPPFGTEQWSLLNAM